MFVVTPLVSNVVHLTSTMLMTSLSDVRKVRSHGHGVRNQANRQKKETSGTVLHFRRTTEGGRKDYRGDRKAS